MNYLDVANLQGIIMKSYLFGFLLLIFSMNSIASVVLYGDIEDRGAGFYQLTNNQPKAKTDAYLESELGLNSGAFDEIAKSLDGSGTDLSANATYGSAMTDALEISFGEVFSFDWTLSGATTSDFERENFRDFAFISLNLVDNSDNTLFSDIYSFADVLNNPNGSLSASDNFTWMATGSGTLAYTIGLMDANNFIPIIESSVIESSLNISNIHVVPLPGAIWLFTFGLVGLFGIKKRA